MENIPGYSFKLYLEKLRLWNRMTDVGEAEQGPTIVGRLKGDAYKAPMGLSIVRARLVPDPNSPAYQISQL